MNSIDELPPEIAELIDDTPIREAQAEIDKANRRHQEAIDAAREAEAAVAESYRGIPDLMQRAVAGEKVTAAMVAKAHQRVRDAELNRDFCQEVARRLTPDTREAEARMSAAKAKVYAPVLECGADLSIAAAKRADKAAGSAYERPDLTEFEAARRAYSRVDQVIGFAIRSGAKHPGAVYRGAWPTTEANQRELWGRPALSEEMAA